MTRLIVPAVAVAMMLGGSPLWAQDKAETQAAMPEMKCAMMGGAGMAGAPASDTVAKLTAKKKELKLNDKQIQQIAAALAAPEHKMDGMAGMSCCNHGAEAGAAAKDEHAEHHK